MSLNKLTETSVVFATMITHQELHIPINMIHFFSAVFFFFFSLSYTSLNKYYKTLSHVLYFTQYKQGYFQFLVTLKNMSEGNFFIFNYNHEQKASLKIIIGGISAFLTKGAMVTYTETVHMDGRYVSFYIEKLFSNFS